MPPHETALLVPVPELDDFVAHWATHVGTPSPQGVPAHIVVMYPFLEPGVVGQHHQLITDIVRNQPRFDFQLGSVQWFGDEVVYLEPEPAEPFIALTKAIGAAWPQCKPYHGQYDEIVPHLTLGIGGDDLAQIASAANQLLPIRSSADNVWLMEGRLDPPIWCARQSYQLRYA